MPHIENSHLFVALEVPISFVGTLFCDTLIEVMEFFTLHINMNLSIH